MLSSPTSCEEPDAVGSFSEPRDEELLQSIVAREQRALAQLHARYKPLLNKIVASILPNPADAEETLQDVLLEIWTRAGSFDVHKGKPLGWIICMARRRAIDHLRRICSRAEFSERLRLHEEQTSDTAAKGRGTLGTCENEIEATDRDVTSLFRAG